MTTKGKAHPLVSIIIPTKNSAATILACIKSIRSQTYKNIEIILVDNFSTDGTVKIAKKFASRIFTKGPERNSQRNFGIVKSKGKYIIWLDSDMKLNKGVVRECVEIMSRDRSLKALVIPEASIGTTFWAKCKALEKRCYLRDKNIEAVRFADKKTILSIGGFSENFISGEDWDITGRLRSKGFKTGRATKFVYHNEGNLSLLSDLSKKYYYATVSLPYLERHVKGPSDVLRFVFRPAFIRNWKVLVSSPILSMGLFIMKFLEFGVGFIGLVVVNTRRSLK